MSSRGPQAAWLALGVLLFIGCWAYVAHLGDVPLSGDAEKWLSRTNPGDAASLDYVFRRRHFIGYRPTAALSFWLTHQLAGWSFAWHRAVDLGLHLLGAVGAWLLARKLCEDSPWAALVAPTVVLLHPAAETVVPHLARRSYGLAWALGCWGALAWVEGLGRSKRGWVALGVVLLWLGAHANEAGYAALVTWSVLTLALGWRGPRGLAMYATATAWALMCVSLAWRHTILGRLGGYHKWHMASFNGDHILLAQYPSPEPQEVVEAAIAYVSLPFDPDGAVAPVGQGTMMFLAAPLLLWCARSLRGRALLITASMGAWLGVILALYAASGTWFWRMGQPLLLPLGVMLAVMAGSLQTAKGPQWLRVTGTLSLLSVLTVLIWHGPADGLSEETTRNRPLATHVWRQLTPHVEDQPRESTVWLALPLSAKTAGAIQRWMLRLHSARVVHLTERRVAHGPGTPVLLWSDEESLMLGPGYAPAQGTFKFFQNGRAQLSDFHRTDPTLVLWSDGNRIHRADVSRPPAQRPVLAPVTPRSPGPPTAPPGRPPG